MTGPLSCPCDGRHLERAWTFDAPPEGETRFRSERPYAREIDRCAVCGHFVSRHELGDIYGGAYVDATYGERMRERYEGILALPSEASDNAGRVGRILRFARGPAAILDVGSGLCVFLARMKEAGWTCTALDPDPRAAAHAREVVGVEAIVGDYLSAEIPGRYDAVTFNKVLEHVSDPVAMLTRSRLHVAAGGFVYVEVPDGEAAVAALPTREEFFIEHLHVFSSSSLAMLAARSGFEVVELERLREPSGKYTLRAFLRAPEARCAACLATDRTRQPAT